jgi:hypothetical protein
LSEQLKNPQTTLHFIVENVAMKDVDQKIFERFLGVAAVKIDCDLRKRACASLMRRARYYFCSFIKEEDMLLDLGYEEFRPRQCCHKARLLYDHKEGLEKVLEVHNFKGFEFFNEDTGEKVVSLGTLTRRAGQVGQAKYWIRRRKINPSHPDFQAQLVPQEINEDLMGFPIGYTNGRSDSERQLLLGNSFMVFHIQLLYTFFHQYLVRNRKAGQGLFQSPQTTCQQLCEREHRESDLHKDATHLLKLMEKKGFRKLDAARDSTMHSYLPNVNKNDSFFLKKRKTVS